MEDQQFAVAEEVAIKEVKAFVKHHARKDMDDEKVLADYPDVVLAVKEGRLTFNDKMEPALKLQDPVLNDQGEPSLSELSFRTRIVASEQQKLANGVDINKNTLLYFHKVMAYIIKQPTLMLDKFSKWDYKTIEQLTTLFL